MVPSQLHSTPRRKEVQKTFQNQPVQYNGGSRTGYQTGSPTVGSQPSCSVKRVVVKPDAMKPHERWEEMYNKTAGNEPRRVRVFGGDESEINHQRLHDENVRDRHLVHVNMNGEEYDYYG
jgi:hypothetical protein